MKILKFILFAIIWKLLFIGGLEAQLLPISICPKNIPDLEIYSIEILHENKGTYYIIDYNEDQFQNFDDYQLQIANTDCNVKKTLQGIDNTCPVDWYEPPFPFCNPCPLNLCDVNDLFRVKVICDKQITYSNELNPQDLYCGYDKLNNQVNENDIIVGPQPAIDFVYFDSKAFSIESIILFNAYGQKIMGRNFGRSNSIQKFVLPKVNDGIYIAQINTKDEVPYYKKIIIRQN